MYSVMTLITATVAICSFRIQNSFVVGLTGLHLPSLVEFFHLLPNKKAIDKPGTWVIYGLNAICRAGCPATAYTPSKKL